MFLKHFQNINLSATAYIVQKLKKKYETSAFEYLYDLNINTILVNLINLFLIVGGEVGGVHFKFKKFNLVQNIEIFFVNKVLSDPKCWLLNVVMLK